MQLYIADAIVERTDCNKTIATMPAPGRNFRRGWAGQPNVLLSENGVGVRA